MTQLDPSLIGSRVQPLQIADLLEQRAQLKMRNETARRQQMADEQAMQDRARAEQARQAARAAGAAYASGDGAGARKTALGAGDFDLAQKLDAMDDGQRKRAFDISQHTAPLLLSLGKVPLEQRVAALAQIAPQLQQAGFTPEHIQELATPEALSDEALGRYGNAAMTIAEYNKANEPFTLGQDQKRFDGQGNQIAAGPESIKAINTPADSTTTILGGAGHTGLPGQPGQGAQRYVNGWSPRARNGGDNSDASVDNYISHVAGKLGIDPTQPIPPAMLPQLAGAMAEFESGGKPTALSVRNNNPGNIKASGGGFRQFASPQAGQGAQQALLAKYFARGQNTIKSIIEGVPARETPNGPMVIHGKAKSDEVPALDDNAVDYVAQQYAATGQLPALGMGTKAAAMRARIIGRAAQLAKQGGISGTEAAGIHADFKANSAALATLQRTANQVLAYERTATMNADEVLRTMGEGAAKSGSPIINAWIQAGRKGVSGDPAVSRFNVAVQTFATEYARVTSGASGGAVTSDSARHEVMSMINNAQTPAQLKAVIDQTKRDMANRRKGLIGQANALRGSLGTRPQGGQADAPAPAQRAAPAKNRPSLDKIFGR